jgi:large subunit ribosomal protein L15
MANELANLHPVEGAQRPRTRIGRGQGSGLGKTAGRGTKGQQARAGSGKRLGFEGGQMPLRRRLPKRGFNNIFAKDYTEVNVGKLAGFDAGTEVDVRLLKAAGVIARIGRDGLKVLGVGEIGVALTVRAAKFSASARSKIEGAGGTAVEDAA